MAVNYDVINQGLYQVQSVTKNTDPVFTYGQDFLFGEPARSTREDFQTFDYSKRGLIIPEEAKRGADPNRRNYGHSFDETHIASLFFFDEFPFNEEIAKTRCDGENDLLHPWTVDKRILYHMAKARDMWRLGRAAVVEKVCWNAVLEGHFEARNGGEQVFPIYNNLLNLAGANLFKDPLKTIKDACMEVIKNGVTPRYIIFNTNDWINLLASDKFSKLLDNRRMDIGSAKSTDINNGAATVGVLNIPGVGFMTAITYAGGIKENNEWKDYLPQGKAVICAGSIGYVGNCGIPVRLGNVQGKEGLKDFAYAYAPETGLQVDTKLQLTSAPCPVITGINHYGVITGIPATVSA